MGRNQLEFDVRGCLGWLSSFWIIVGCFLRLGFCFGSMVDFCLEPGFGVIGTMINVGDFLHTVCQHKIPRKI